MGRTPQNHSHSGPGDGGKAIKPEQVLLEGLPQWSTDLRPNAWMLKHPSNPRVRVVPYVGGAGVTFRGLDNFFRMSLYRDTPTTQGATAADIGAYRFEAVNSNGAGFDPAKLKGIGTDFNAGSETGAAEIVLMNNGADVRTVRFNPFNMTVRGSVSINGGYGLQIGAEPGNGTKAATFEGISADPGTGNIGSGGRLYSKNGGLYWQSASGTVTQIV